VQFCSFAICSLSKKKPSIAKAVVIGFIFAYSGCGLFYRRVTFLFGNWNRIERKAADASRSHFFHQAAKFSANFVCLLRHTAFRAGACQMESSEQDVNCISLGTT